MLSMLTTEPSYFCACSSAQALFPEAVAPTTKIHFWRKLLIDASKKSFQIIKRFFNRYRTAMRTKTGKRKLIHRFQKLGHFNLTQTLSCTHHRMAGHRGE